VTPLPTLTGKMRVSHLLAGVAGLFAVAFAAPAPESTLSPSTATDVTADASPMPGKARVCNSFGGKGDCIDVITGQSCMPLPNSLIFNVQSISQDPYTFCFYTKSLDCKSTAFVAISTISVQAIDLTSTWSRRIAGVQCIPVSPNPLHAWLSTAPDVSSAQVSAYNDKTAFTARDTPPFALAIDPPTHPLTLRNATHHLLPAGDALLCSAELSTDPCFTAHADGQCTDITGPVNRNVRTVYQSRGSLCEYFISDRCQARLGSSNSTRGDLKVVVPPEVVGRIGSARCTLTSKGELGDSVDEGGESAATFVED